MTYQTKPDDTIWVVVADESIARFLQLPDTGTLVEVESLVDEEARARGAELRLDAQGRRAPGVAMGADGSPTIGSGSVTVGAGESELHKEADTFARQVAGRLLECFHQRRFQALWLVAAPRFLGLLRTHLDTAVRDVVTVGLDKDLTHASAADLTHRLFPEHDGPRRKLEPRAAAESESGNEDIGR